MATATALLLVLCLTQVEAAPPSPAPTPRIAQPIPTPQALASFEALPGPVLLAAGLGLGVPFGTAPGSVSMSQLARPQLRLPLQVGFRITPEVLVGAYVDIGFGKAGPVALDACHAAGGTGCGATSIHVGVLGRYAFTPGDHGTFWLTAGAGWESTGVTYGGGAPGNLSYSGPEARLGGGYDFRNDGRIGYGLFLDGAAGQYHDRWGPDGSGALSNQPLHVWVQAGVRLLLLP